MGVKYYEDINMGDRVTTAGKTITDTFITLVVGLAGYTEPFFHDEEYAKKSIFGGRVAPGVLTIMAAGALVEQSGFWKDSALGLMALNNLEFKGPVKAGDTITVEMDVYDKKETSKPDRGLVWDRKVIRNQRGEVVASFESVHLVRRRP